MEELYVLCLQMRIVVYIFHSSGFPQNECRFLEYTGLMKSQVICSAFVQFFLLTLLISISFTLFSFITFYSFCLFKTLYYIAHFTFKSLLSSVSLSLTTINAMSKKITDEKGQSNKNQHRLPHILAIEYKR